MAEFAVIGMGRFGRAVARKLALEDQSVVALDVVPARLDAVAADVDSVLAVDSTDEAAMKDLGLERVSCVIVTIGSRATEASILTTAILREIGIDRILARAFDPSHARLLVAVGAHEVLNPEEEIAGRLARSLAHPDVLDEIRLDEAVIAEVEAPEAFDGRDLGELELDGSGDVHLLAIRRGGSTLLRPTSETRLESGDVLVLFGPREPIRRIGELL